MGAFGAPTFGAHGFGFSPWSMLIPQQHNPWYQRAPPPGIFNSNRTMGNLPDINERTDSGYPSPGTNPQITPPQDPQHP